MKESLNLSKQGLAQRLWDVDQKFKGILTKSKDVEEARGLLLSCLNELERSYFDANQYSHILERANAKECIRVLKNFLSRENEKRAGFSALNALYEAASPAANLDNISEGFLIEMIFLFRGINGKSNILGDGYNFEGETGREAALKRSEHLDKYSKEMKERFKRYRCGTDKAIVEKRGLLKKEILKHFNATEKDWDNYQWHIDNVITDYSTLSSLAHLDEEETKGVKAAEDKKIPFQITPYYLSLFNKSGKTDHDRVVRAQVIPSQNYCFNVARNQETSADLDFMGEHSTSPIDCITRRYPQILILKPYDSCPQICVYCQRNWEIKTMDDAKITKDRIQKAIGWVRENENITEVLITGGDPFTLDNEFIEWLIDEVASIPHVERIRIGTRVLVTLPFRIDDELIGILKKHHRLGEREVCIVTHYEHPIELTPESLEAIRKLKAIGISIYNQQVFTYFNSRKYESCFLRRMLKLSGVDPYYSFNSKGKEETRDFRVPIARIEQERKEEARLLPGIVRTDEPVFNVPKLGKSHLRAWQDHEPIMLLADGKRVYRFYPWEAKIAKVDDYLYTDVAIYDYLKRLDADGEDIEEYSSIWYYF